MEPKRYTEHRRYLIVDTAGTCRIVRRAPSWVGGRGAAEFVFLLNIRIPAVTQPDLAGRLTLELPPAVDPDARPVIEATGPVALRTERSA